MQDLLNAFESKKEPKNLPVDSMREKMSSVTYEHMHDDSLPRGTAVDELADIARKLNDCMFL